MNDEQLCWSPSSSCLQQVMTVVCLFPAPCKGMGYTKKSGEKRTSIHRRWDFGALYVDIQSQQERSFWATAIKQTSLKHSHHSLHMSHPTSEDFPRNPQMLRFVTWAGLSLPSRPEYTIYGFPYIYMYVYTIIHIYEQYIIIISSSYCSYSCIHWVIAETVSPIAARQQFCILRQCHATHNQDKRERRKPKPAEVDKLRRKSSLSEL